MVRNTALLCTFCIFIFLVITVFYPFIQFGLTGPDETQSYESVQVIGHRGTAGLAPENTLASFQKALDLGVDMIELDIHLTADNEIVVMHDPSVKRTTNGQGEIVNLTLAAIKQLDAGSWFDSGFSDQKVPTLKEVLDLVNGQCTLLIELKWPKSGIYEDLVTELLQVIEERHAQSWVNITSFETAYIKEAITLNSNIKYHQLIFGLSNILPIYFDRKMRFGFFKPMENVTSVCIYYRYLNSSIIEYFQKQNIGVGVFTVNREKDILRAASLGASSIITDYPNVAIPLIKD